MVFYINLSIFFIKNFLNYLFIVDTVFNQNFRIILATIIIGICNYFLYTYYLDYTKIADKPMNSVGKHIINICIILFFIIVFIGGIFWLRISNINRTLDVYHVIEDTLEYYSNTSTIKIFLIIVLLIVLIIFYIQMFQLLIRIFKYNIIKRHLWLYRFDDLLNYGSNLITLKNFTLMDLVEVNCCIWLLDNKRFYYKSIKPYYRGFRRDIVKLIPFIVYKGHYVLLLSVILYDLIFNNGVLEHMFVLLPFIFLYEIYYKISKFIYFLQSGLDELLYKTIYKTKGTLFISNYEFCIGGDIFDVHTMGHVHYAKNYYLRRGLYSYMLDPEGRKQEGDSEIIINEFNEQLVDNLEWEEQIKDIKVKYPRFD